MFYLITKDSSILLGPVAWNPGYFNRMLSLYDIQVSFPILEPKGYLNIGLVQVYPVSSILEPPHSSIFEELKGPFWEFNSGQATGFYKVIKKDITITKLLLKEEIANLRYLKEIKGFTMHLHGNLVTCDSSRDNRLSLINTYMSNSVYPITWKFPETSLLLDKSDLYNIINTIAIYVQEQFVWEKSMIDYIDNASTTEELRSLLL